jgi:GTP-binding protein
MQIKSLEFISQIGPGEDIPETDHPHVAFIGRSNVGKSSLINTLAQRKGLARPSAKPGFTKTINFYLVNKAFYLVDLPGYGFAQGSFDERKNLQQLIEWYLTYPDLTENQIIILIIDAKVGFTELDHQMLTLLQNLGKNVIVVANKIDKLKKNELSKKIKSIEEFAHPYKVIPISNEDKTGIPALTHELFNKTA